MKAYFEEPVVELHYFPIEDTITVSGMRGLGASSGFDEVEPTRGVITLIPPCLN